MPTKPTKPPSLWDSKPKQATPKGPWFKWKRDALTVDTVLMYAQRGHGRRSSFFRGELLNALRMVDRGLAEPQRMRGSWAGAMGQSQFMPSSFLAYAYDYDGDGKPDFVYGGGGFLRYASPDPANPTAAQLINQYFLTVNIWTIVLNIAWLVPVLILTPVYFNSIEYSVKADSGNTMPEIYQKEGIIFYSDKEAEEWLLTNDQ